MEETIARRIGREVIGFSRYIDGDRSDERGKSGAAASTRDELMRHLTPKDLIEYGMIPEFVGRLPVMTTLDTLERDDLVRILTEPRNALVRQYQSLFVMEDAQLEFTRDGLQAIADIAIDRETGVRALRSILEERLLDLLYELPNRKDTRVFTLDADVVRGVKSLARGLVADDAPGNAADETPEDASQDGEEPSSSVERESA